MQETGECESVRRSLRTFSCSGFRFPVSGFPIRFPGSGFRLYRYGINTLSIGYQYPIQIPGSLGRRSTTQTVERA